jgi:hypothetical protein
MSPLAPFHHSSWQALLLAVLLFLVAFGTVYLAVLHAAL